MTIHDVTSFGLSYGPGIALDPHMPDTRQTYTSMPHILAGQQAPAIPMGGIRPTLEPLARFEAGIAGLLPSLHPPEEGFERQVHALERVLRSLCGQWRVLRVPERGQITTLFSIPQADPLARPRRLPLLQGRVIQQAMGFPLGLQGRVLGRRGIQAVCGATIDRVHTIYSNGVMDTKQRLVASLHATDKYCGPIPCRLSRVYQPAIRSRNPFAGPHSPPWACLWAHPGRLALPPSTGVLD